jgi:hypothetical protein
MSVMAWPLMFWMVATRIGCATEPRPMLIATGIGERGLFGGTGMSNPVPDVARGAYPGQFSDPYSTGGSF